MYNAINDKKRSDHIEQYQTIVAAHGQLFLYYCSSFDQLSLLSLQVIQIQTS